MINQLPHDYTPGPWEAHGLFVGTKGEDPQTIAYIDNHRNRKERSTDEDRANARLIATAPELIEAASELVSKLKALPLDSEEWVHVQQLKNAINKALGK